jgi:uncharacterized protein YcfJ
MENIMNTVNVKTLSAASLSLALCLGFSADALADGRSGHGRQAPQMQQRQQAYRAAPQRVQVQRPPIMVTRYAPQHRVVVGSPFVVYRAPLVVYQQPVIYSQPAYYYPAPVVVYESAPPQVIQQVPQPLPAEPTQSGLSAAQVVGAVAGGVIGSRFGGGNGRLITTAAGAVLGSVIGEQVAGDR